VQASLLRTLPIGVLLFFLTYLALRRKRSERGKSLVELPAFAAAEALRYQERTTGQVGVVSGQYKGYEVRIDPENGAKIWLGFTNSPKVQLRNFRFLKRQPAGLQQMLTSFRQFDAFFVERYVDGAAQDALFSLGDLNKLVDDFKASPQRLVTVSVSPEGIECRLVVERVPYISREMLEYLLPKLVRIAQALDKPLAASSTELQS
jgi:hypothetical protein